MSESTEVAESVISVDQIPPAEREQYLRELSPEDLEEALFEAADRASTKSRESVIDNLAFCLMQALGWIAEYSVASDLQKVRDDAKYDVELLIPSVVRFLNDRDEPFVSGDKSDEERRRLADAAAE